jgi:hypothetical protein
LFTFVRWCHDWQHSFTSCRAYPGVHVPWRWYNEEFL